MKYDIKKINLSTRYYKREMYYLCFFNFISKRNCDLYDDNKKMIVRCLDRYQICKQNCKNFVLKVLSKDLPEDAVICKG